jgi:hypothetical protein
VNPNTSTGFKGVWRDKKTGKCWAQIYFEGKLIHLGSFATAEDAARAYDRKAIELFGQFARLNFPEDYEAQDRAEQATQPDRCGAGSRGSLDR